MTETQFNLGFIMKAEVVYPAHVCELGELVIF